MFHRELLTRVLRKADDVASICYAGIGWKEFETTSVLVRTVLGPVRLQLNQASQVRTMFASGSV